MSTTVQVPPQAGVTFLDALAVVCCHGPLHGEGVTRLRETLGAAFTDGARDIVVTTHEVTRVNAAGLAVLVAAARRARASGGSLHLAAPSAGVVRAVHVTGLHHVLPVLAGPPASWTDPCVLDAARARPLPARPE